MNKLEEILDQIDRFRFSGGKEGMTYGQVEQSIQSLIAECVPEKRVSVSLKDDWYAAGWNAAIDEITKELKSRGLL